MKNKQRALEQNYDQKFSPKKKAGTRLEEEKKAEFKEAEEAEKLAVTGQESEKKGRKWIGEEVEASDRISKKAFADELEWLRSKRRFRDEEYLMALASILHHKLKSVDWPLGFHWRVVLEGRRLRVEFQDRYGRWFKRGVTVLGEPKYDYKAVEILSWSAEDTIDQIEKPDGSLKKTGGGVYLP